MKYNLSGLTRLEKWEDIPKPWVKVKIPSKVALGNKDLNAPEYKKLLAPYLNKTDTLRDAFRVVNVSDIGITATDAHRLLAIPDPGVKQGEGAYDIMGYVDKTKSKGQKIDLSYPKVEQVFPEKNDFVHEVDVLKWRAYTEAMMLGNYSNQTTNQIVYQAKGFAYGLNGEFVLTICNTFLMLGYDKVYVGITSNYRACIISPVVEAAKNPKKYLGVKVIALQMPLMLHEDSSSKPEDYLGARDVDFGTESKVYYSFVDNEIHDADGKVAKFNPSEYEDGELGYISEENMKLLATYLRKSKAGRSIPILENVAVSKNTVRVTDLESEIILTNVPVEDGIYSIINGAFKPALMELDDYPIPQSERYKGSNSAGSLEVQTLATIFSEAKNMVGDDDLRPAMTGVCIQNEGDVTTFYATDAFVLYKRILNNTPLDVKQIIVPNPEMVSKVLERMTEKYVEVYLSEKSESIAFKSQGIIYLTRLIDARPPGYEMVIDKEVNESITFNQDQLIEVSGKAKKISKESPLVIQIPTVTDEKVEVKVYGKDGASKNDDEVSNLELIGNITATKQSGRFDNTDKDLIIAMGLSNKTDEAKSYYRLSPKVLDRVLAVSKKGSFTFYHPEKPAEYGKYFYHLPPLSGEDKKEVRPVTVKKIKPSASKEAKTTEKPKYDAAFMDKMIKRLRLALKYAPDSAAIQKQIKSLETAKKYAI